MNLLQYLVLPRSSAAHYIRGMCHGGSHLRSGGAGMMLLFPLCIPHPQKCTCARAFIEQVMTYRLCPERRHEPVRANLHKEREAYFRKNIPVEATPAEQCSILHPEVAGLSGTLQLLLLVLTSCSVKRQWSSNRNALVVSTIPQAGSEEDNFKDER